MEKTHDFRPLVTSERFKLMDVRDRIGVLLLTAHAAGLLNPNRRSALALLDLIDSVDPDLEDPRAHYYSSTLRDMLDSYLRGFELSPVWNSRDFVCDLDEFVEERLKIQLYP